MITDYKQLPDLRRADPSALVQMHGESGDPGQSPARFLRRLFPDDDAWTQVNWDAVAASVWADAADMERILADYPETEYTDGDGDGEDRRCTVCDAGDICRTGFETDAADVASEADAPLAEVMRWMHAGELHSNVDSIGTLADRFREERAAGILMRRGVVESQIAHS